MRKVSALLSTLFIFSALVISCNSSEVADKQKTYEERYKELENNIRNNADWLASVQQKAKDRNIPLDSMIRLDIEWTIDEQDGKHKPENKPVATAIDSAGKKSFDDRVKEIIENMKHNSDWLIALQKKAADRKIPLDSMMLIDARWTVDDQDGKHK
ncbi:MAG: hypothetical protein HYR66_01335 [Sphingobacteriales bacterium]|nr:hypothetical protein [Sphingobacteriales bacterium]MBI3718720.1 hypothetical protein [Sphingobacteriales bacterium]